ncbi:nucleotidyltransferase family protein [Thermomonas carbonis]|uniref:Nucleotidyltransferase family protein n=1 Tax=Thermomonas carbonis TaxID=1463158 RepID=A0A7G9SN58_9GAMM|nr:nucleotidyltransferase family protein [Thermomonas carbonis]QNN69283.1 nucleotidyltransferase family protein [Thermomonas carbonis]
MLTAASEQSARAWLAAALRDGCLPADAGLQDVGQLLDAAANEGVVALLESRLRGGPDWGALPAALREGLADGARAAAAQWLLRERELRRIAEVFAHANIRVLVLKGSALALWLYPQPYLRMGGDIDLLFESRGEAERAAQALKALGYALAFAPAETHFEMTSRLVVDGVMRSELDLHYRLLNSAAYADIFGFDELWQEASTQQATGEWLRTLAPLHAWIHACLNRALDLQNRIPDRLKLLYDIRLFAARSGRPQWETLCDLAQAKHIAGPCLHSLEDAMQWLDADVPTDVLARMRGLAEVEAIDYRRLGDWRYMQWQNLKSLPTLSARMQWVRERLLPGTHQLRELHGEGGWWTLMMRRIGRGLARLR